MTKYKMRNYIIATLFLFFLYELSISEAKEEILTIKLVPRDGMTRADVHYLDFEYTPKAILVLAEGYNSDSKNFLSDPNWINFAKENKLILMGISFASEICDLKNGKGYYYAEKESGQVLLDAIEQITPCDLKIFLFGFSGGAHFVSQFVQWKPDKVKSWCAYAAGWWSGIPKGIQIPLGIIACGDIDNRLDACFTHFVDLRSKGMPVLWVKLKNTSHVLSERLESFVRIYFKTILQDKFDPVFIELENYTNLGFDSNLENNGNNVYLPNHMLLEKWKYLMESD